MNNKILDVLATTPLQAGLLALHELSSGADPYHVQFVFRIDGQLDASLLQQCAQLMLDRHPNLKAAFYNAQVSHPVQVIPRATTINWEVIDRQSSTANTADFDELTAEFARTEFRRPFDLSQPAPLRLRLLRWTPQCHHLVLTAHHIIIDGWSAPLFFAELIKLYQVRGRVELLPPPLAYRRYIAWLSEQSLAETHNVWRAELGENPTACLIAPGAQPSPGDPPVVVSDHLDPHHTQQLQNWCRRHNVTLGNAVLFAWAVVLGALVDRDEVFTGTVVSGRPSNLPGAESMIGLFINTVPARIQLHPDLDPITQITRLRDQLLRTRSHEYIGLSDIQRQLRTRDLFDTLVVHQNTPQDTATSSSQAKLRVTPLATNDATHYPLTIVPATVDGMLHIKVEARADLIDTLLPPATTSIPTAILALLQAFPTSDGVALAQLGTGFPATALPYAPLTPQPRSLPELILELVAENPQAIAIRDADNCLTRKQFLAASLAIVEAFHAAGLQPHDRVALALSRSVWQPAALLACAWTGVVAVLLDASAPQEHNGAIAAQAQAKVVLSDSDFNGDIPVLLTPSVITSDVETHPPVHHNPDAPLYMVFTSGSTGQPKGVIGTGRGIAALIAAHKQLIWNPAAQQCQRQLTVGHAWSLAFDASWQPLTALFAGHAVAILNETEITDPTAYLAALRRYRVDMIETSPTMLSHLKPAGLLHATEQWPGLTLLGLGGEPIGPEDWQWLAQTPGLDSYNFYGPTETTVDATAMKITSGTQPRIGTPLPGVKAWLLDRWLRPTPPGIAGELYFSGAQITIGYADLSAVTASHFVATTGGQRMYRTGDHAIYHPETATLEYLGRTDNQIKIRGHRVEVGHILQEISKLPQVAAAQVIITPTPVTTGVTHTPRIVAVVIPTSPSDMAEPAAFARSLMALLRKTVAAHLIPTAIIPVSSFPMTANGKIDVSALPEITSESQSPPQGELEIQLADAITELTGITSIDRDTDIRDIGVDSILLMQLTTKVVSRAPDDSPLHHLTPRLVLTNPTIRGIASNVAKTAAPRNEEHTIDVFSPTPIQQWLINTGSGRRFSQWALLETPQHTSGDKVCSAIRQLMSRHALLRAQLDPVANIFTISSEPPAIDTWFHTDTTVTTDQFARKDFAAFKEVANAAIEKIDPTQGIMLQAVWFPQLNHVLVLAHHFAVDGASWRILLAELNGITSTQSTSFPRWAQLLHQHRETLNIPDLQKQWGNYLGNHHSSPLGSRAIDPIHDKAANAISATITHPATALLATADVIGQGSSGTIGLQELLLALLAQTIYEWRGEAQTIIDLEGHGRDLEILEQHGQPYDDLSQTIGWFTTITPTVLPMVTGQSLTQLTHDVARLIANQPSTPIDYSIACGISTSPAEIEVNYLGRLDTGHSPSDQTAQWTVTQNRDIYSVLPEMPDPELPRTYSMEITFSIIPGQHGSELSAHFNLAAGVFSTSDLDSLGQCWSDVVSKVASPLEPDTEPH